MLITSQPTAYSSIEWRAYIVLEECILLRTMPTTALRSLTGNDRTPWPLGRGSMPRLREIFPLIAIVFPVLVRDEIYFAIWLREENQ